MGWFDKVVGGKSSVGGAPATNPAEFRANRQKLESMRVDHSNTKSLLTTAKQELERVGQFSPAAKPVRSKIADLEAQAEKMSGDIKSLSDTVHKQSLGLREPAERKKKGEKAGGH